MRTLMTITGVYNEDGGMSRSREKNKRKASNDKRAKTDRNLSSPETDRREVGEKHKNGFG